MITTPSTESDTGPPAWRLALLIYLVMLLGLTFLPLPPLPWRRLAMALRR